ncbi:MAG: protoporphyrinogen oxidase [Acidobacteriaceae bacterium]|nr:protoporphyrinogen oxidase [Acidobacteriaceae bacterium]
MAESLASPLGGQSRGDACYRDSPGFCRASGFRHSWWFRGSALLLLVTAALHGQGRRAVRSGLADGGNGYAALRRIERIGYAMCVLVLAITILMVVKPF